MSKDLTREEKILLPDWEAIFDFFEDETNKNDNITIKPFLCNDPVYQLVISKSEITIYTRGLGPGGFWNPLYSYMRSEHNYTQAYEILERVFKRS